ncbi:MAG: hypothetical protein V4665_02345 [Patescibacteria group bacterium]
MARAYIHNHTVSYDDKSSRLRHAVYYLQYFLSKDDAEVFFKKAKEGSSARFEDDNFVRLKLKRGDGEYILTLRKE